ncbi:hypothetical protein ACGFNP_08670 [Nonomuraea sp. NPDC049269]|uniref:hypothetical protein n=1 Tax=Nonomuraea sp. NPDC049269 TaxID=3364349 RepID=UPI0037241380
MSEPPCPAVHGGSADHPTRKDSPNLPATRPVEEHADQLRRLTRRLADRLRIQPHPPAGQIVSRSFSTP